MFISNHITTPQKQSKIDQIFIVITIQKSELQTNKSRLLQKVKNKSHIPVNAFFAPLEDPAGITFKTLNLTVFESGLCKWQN